MNGTMISKSTGAIKCVTKSSIGGQITAVENPIVAGDRMSHSIIVSPCNLGACIDG
jgi:hypothetical protein